MKKLAKTILFILSIGLMTAVVSCSNDDCPSKTFNSLQDCEDATDGKKCICIKEGSGWKAVINP